MEKFIFLCVNHIVLDQHFKNDNKKEIFIVEQGFDNVDVILSDNSAVYLVEQVHKYEGMENYGV